MKTFKHQSLTQFVLQVIKPYKGYLVIFGFLALFWASINTLLPYVLKIIIDKVSEFQVDKGATVTIIQPYTFLYMFLWIIACLNMRLLDWAKLKLFPSIRQNTSFIFTQKV